MKGTLKIELLAAGTKPPQWISAGVVEYQKRMPRECALTIREIAIARRVKNDSMASFQKREEERICQQLVDGARVIALDSSGVLWDTATLCEKLKGWMMDYSKIQLIIGGPDGLSANCLARADETWSLSRLTFPHFLVRVLVAEQLYRAWSMLNNHPYHR